MRHIRTTKGMTLIEVLVTSALLSMLGIVLFATLTQSLRGWSAGTSRDSATSNVTIALQKLSKDIRDGRSATVSSGGTVLTVTFPRSVTDGTTHETVYDPSANDAQTRSYYVLNGRLVRNRGGTISVIARGVTTVGFGGTNSNISVTLTSNRQTGARGCTQTVTSQLALRNFRS